MDYRILMAGASEIVAKPSLVQVSARPLPDSHLHGDSLMNANTGSIQRAIVGRGWDMEWFDTMPGERMALRVHSREVGGAFTIVEARVPPLSGPPVHLHKDREEIFEVLDGEFRFRCAGEEFDVTPGTTVVVPRGAEHGWVNLGPRPSWLLFTFVPGGIDDFFAEIGRTSPDNWTELARRHDTWIVGPPIHVNGSNRRLSPASASGVVL
jgi:mannose-6-phosphate isomerase-like protein (cupin superfamily)